METPQIRPGKVSAHSGPETRVVALFRNAAQGNAVIQMLGVLGVPSDRLGVTPPDQMATRQGMLLSIGCPTEDLVPKVEAICRGQGAEVHRQPG